MTDTKIHSEAPRALASVRPCEKPASLAATPEIAAPAAAPDWRTAVIADACGDRHPAPHEANLFDMNAKYADVVGEGEAIAFLHGLKSIPKES